MKPTLALLLALLPAQALAQDFRAVEPSVLYFVSIPLGAHSRAERDPVVGFALQGTRPYQAVRMDTRVMSLLEAGAIDAKWLIVGAVAAGAAVAAGGNDGSVERQQAQQAQAQAHVAANPPPSPCPSKPNCFALRR